MPKKYKPKNPSNKNRSVPASKRTNILLSKNTRDYFLNLFAQQNPQKTFFFPYEIIKYTMQIVKLDDSLKRNLTSHNEYSVKFFEDLRQNEFTKLIFTGCGASAHSLSAAFSKIKYELEDLSKNEEDYQFVLNYLDKQNTRISYENVIQYVTEALYYDKNKKNLNNDKIIDQSNKVKPTTYKFGDYEMNLFPIQEKKKSEVTRKEIKKKKSTKNEDRVKLDDDVLIDNFGEEIKMSQSQIYFFDDVDSRYYLRRPESESPKSISDRISQLDLKGNKKNRCAVDLVDVLNNQMKVVKENNNLIDRNQFPQVNINNKEKNIDGMVIPHGSQQIKNESNNKHESLSNINIANKQEQITSNNPPLPHASNSDYDVLFIISDVEHNIQTNSSSKFEPNKILYRRDLPHIQLIHSMIQLIRKHFVLNMDDSQVHRDIVSRINYDLIDIFKYLSAPVKYKYVKWTDEDDKILLNADKESDEYKNLEVIKGVDRVKRRLKFYQR